uniref:serpin-ZX-like n=1 Tax=Fragaria vesca subsp. vesca TaxID=101020 RepID=UPI0005C83938|nr:PREDICTED: serpin-ZX-like [Fragaria vesca subsp. vesca]
MDPENPIEPASKKRKTTTDLKQWITNQTNVGLEITKQLLQTEFKNTNMVYSPLSIHIVLSIVAAGKRGSDLDGFLSFLKSKSVDDLNSLAYYLTTSVLADQSAKGGPCLNLAVGLWADQSEPLDDSYKEVVCESYKAALELVDFKANPDKVRVEVNSWVEKMTKGLITNILSPNAVTNRTRRIFANALYFKASWDERYKFYEPYTKKEDHEFHLLNGDSIKGVPYMTSSDSHFMKAFDGFKVLKS